jgi:tetratricopeptide (TPR) repeat protein
MSNLSTLHTARGRLRKAMDIFREIHEFDLQCRTSQEAAFSSAVVLIESLCYELNRLDKTREYLDEAISITGKYDFFDRILLLHDAIARLNCAGTDFDVAKKSLKRCKAILDDNGMTTAAKR